MTEVKRQVFRGWFRCAGMSMFVMMLGAGASGQERPGETRMMLEAMALQTGSGAQLQAERGRIHVPERWSLPNGTKIELAFVRVKRHQAPSDVAHVLLAGGPGASGIDLIREIARNGGEPFLEWLGADVIGIDQRGTGLSVPNLGTEALYELPLEVPGTREQYLSIITDKSRQVAEGFRQRGVDLSAYNTQESADDVEAVRAALGYRKIVLWGRSYGSHLAMATLRRHESRVQKVILCSPEGPDHTLKLPSYTQDALARLAELVRKDPRISGSVPDLLALIKQVLDRLETAPVKVQTTHPMTGQPVTVGIGKFDVQFLTAQALGNQAQMRALPRAYVKMSRGEFDEMARLLVLKQANPPAC